MTRLRFPLCALAAMILTALPLTASDAPSPDAAAAYETLKSLAGSWAGTYDGADATLRFEVTAGGNTVVQTLFTGEPHEMKTLYFLEGGRLVGQHYCVLGNQPRYRFEAQDDPAVIRMVFDGGTNLDPAKDHHAHDGYLKLREDGTLETLWTFWDGGKANETQPWVLRRTE